MKTPVTLALAAALVFSAVTADAADPPDKRATIADFALKNLKGKRVKLSDFKGKVVVVNFWATWCVPCLQELPFLADYYDKYKDQGFTVLAVTIDGPETFSRVRSVVKRRKWKMPILLDQDGSVAAMLNPRGTNPYTMFVDRQGRVAHDHEGYNSGDEKGYEDVIKRLLAEPAPS